MSTLPVCPEHPDAGVQLVETVQRWYRLTEEDGVVTASEGTTADEGNDDDTWIECRTCLAVLPHTPGSLFDPDTFIWS